jgi:hypothetical protein
MYGCSGSSFCKLLNELVNDKNFSTGWQIGNLLHVFAAVFPGQNRQDGHVGDHIGVLRELLDCLAQCGLGLLEASQVNLRDGL